MHSPLLAKEESVFSRHFEQQLEEIRGKIETLPEEQRPYFQTLADQAERDHRDMQDGCARVRNMVDDMRLREASARFNLWAGAKNAERMLDSSGT